MRPIANALIGIDTERLCISLHLTVFDWGFSYSKLYRVTYIQLGPLSLMFHRPRKVESIDEYFDRKLDTNTESD